MKEKKLPDLIASSAMMRYLPSFAGVKSRKMRIGRKTSMMTNYIFLSISGAFASFIYNVYKHQLAVKLLLHPLYFTKTVCILQFK